jgi:hypothetical protein
LRPARRPISRVALATCAELPAGDPDDRPLVAALAAAGVASTWSRWDDPSVDWAGFDAVLIRSTWDYQLRRDQFLAWAGRVPALVNPAEVVRWNTDKRYLAELAAEGIPVVETSFVDPGQLPELPPAGEVVVKPSVSAGSKDTARFAVGDPAQRAAAQELVGRIHEGGRAAMVQPYLDAVDAEGETALLYFGGAFSHAVRKGPLLRLGAGPTEDLFAAETIGPRTPSADEAALGGRVVGLIAERFGMPVYARVDLVPSADGAPVVLEVELTEPSLFFRQAEGAAQRFVEALAERTA